ncbi:MAG: hypothetical protein AB7M05_05870 [Alphaproteobacteria bacterium]
MSKEIVGVSGGDVLSIRSVADLMRLSAYRPRTKPIRRIEVHISGISESERASYEKQLNRHFFACGCAEASVAAILGTVGAIVWIALTVDSWSDLSWHQPALLAGTFIIATGIGKFTGRLISRFRLEQTKSALRKTLAPPDAGPSHAHDDRCGFGRWHRQTRQG